VSDRTMIHDMFSGRCAYCGQEIFLSDMHVDHITPQYRGGDSSPENLYPSCRSCNLWKSTYTVEEFRREIGLQRSRLKKVPGYRLAMKYGLIRETGKSVKFHFENKPEIPIDDEEVRL